MNAPLLLTAFGSTAPEALDAYRHIDHHARRRFPSHSIDWAYTSPTVVERLRAQGQRVAHIADAAPRAAANTVVAPLLTVAGAEHARIASHCAPRLVCAKPLLDCEDDVPAVVDALAPSLRAEAANVVVCHGNARHHEHNRLLLALAAHIAQRFAHTTVASIEGPPGIGAIERARRQAQELGRVHFVPFLLVAGRHVLDDVLGDDASSWRNQIAARETTCAPALAWNDGVLELFCQRIDAALRLAEAAA